MNIVLTGYRGTGKSVVGDLLSERLGMRSIGMDAEIVKRAGISIPEIVAKYGWHGFRDLESQLVNDLTALDNIIIDTGGGVIERPENIDKLRINSHIFWLKASVDVIVSRIKGDTGRPALSDGKTFTEEVEDILKQRTPKYKNAAQYEIDTDMLTPMQVADRIIEIWKGEQKK